MNLIRKLITNEGSALAKLVLLVVICSLFVLLPLIFYSVYMQKSTRDLTSDSIIFNLYPDGQYYDKADNSPQEYSWSCNCTPTSFQVVLASEAMMVSDEEISTYYTAEVSGHEKSISVSDSRWEKIVDNEHVQSNPSNLIQGRYYWWVHASQESGETSSPKATFYKDRSY